MNKKQRVLTVIALIVFVLISVGHHVAIRRDYQTLEWVDDNDFLPDYNGPGLSVRQDRQFVPHLERAWFMLGVIYAGLFFLLADRKEKRP
jgi:hypothetical protein